MKQLDEMERMATSRVESEQRDLRDIAECRRMEALNTLTGAARDATIGALPEPVPCKGALGFWTLPDGIEAAVRAQLSEAA